MHWKRIIFLTAWLGGAAAWGAPDFKPDDVNVMPAFEVASLTAEFQSWIKLRTLHFVLYTDASMKEAREVLRQAEACRTAEEKFFGREFTRAAPVILVMPTASSDWRKLESKTKVQWRIAVSTSGRSIANVVTVQYDWQQDGLNVFQGALATATLPRLGINGPLWFNRGAGLFFETLELNGDKLYLGAPNLRRTDRLKDRGWLPWSEFFGVTVDSPEFVRASEIPRFDGQCAVFMHYLLKEPDPIWRERLFRWAGRFSNGNVPTEADFKSVFGQDWKEWQRTMQVHVGHTESDSIHYDLTAAELGWPAEVLDLRTREMRDLFVLVQILNQTVPASLEALDYVLAHGLKTPALRAMLVTACFDKNRPQSALAQLRAMIEAHTDDPQVFIEAAQLRFLEVLPRVTVESRLGAAAAEIGTWSRRALELEAKAPGARDLLAWSEALGPECTMKNADAIAEVFKTTEPRERKDHVAIAMAVALWRAGDSATARKLCDALIASATVRPEIQELAAQLVAKLGAAK